MSSNDLTYHGKCRDCGTEGKLYGWSLCLGCYMNEVADVEDAPEEEPE